MTVREVIRKASDSLRVSGVENPMREAAFALASVLECSSAEVYIQQDITQNELDRFEDIISRRSNGEPLQLILGEWEFFGRRILLEKGVFVPRPETERLVEIVLERLDRDSAAFGFEFGVGSGAICVNILAERPNIRMCGIDIEDAAIELTRKNAELYGVIDRIYLYSDEKSIECSSKFDFIVSNPPYVLSMEMKSLSREVMFDPVEALDGGSDGMESILKIVEIARRRLRPGGFLAMEIHEEMGAQIAAFLKNSLSSIEILRDYNDRERYIVALRE